MLSKNCENVARKGFDILPTTQPKACKCFIRLTHFITSSLVLYLNKCHPCSWKQNVIAKYKYLQQIILGSRSGMGIKITILQLICCLINILKPTGYVMHQKFNIQQLYFLPTLYLCVLYLYENKQRLVPLRA